MSSNFIRKSGYYDTGSTGLFIVTLLCMTSDKLLRLTAGFNSVTRFLDNTVHSFRCQQTSGNPFLMRPKRDADECTVG